MNEKTLREAVVAIARASVAAGLNHVSSGNVSVRIDSTFLITPSGTPALDITPEQVVRLTLFGDPVPGLNPSSEWRFHRDIYCQRPEIEAIVHVHSPFAVSLACLRRDIPPFHYMVAAAGGKDIRCSGYATFGTQALSDLVLAALTDRRACLMANHGMVATGRTLDSALALAIEVENLCEQYWRACTIGEPVLLSDAEMNEALAKFQHYGPR